MLHAPRPIPGRASALAHVGPQYAGLVRRAKGPPEQPVAHQLANPLTVEHVALATADLLGRPGIDQVHLEPRTVQHLEHRNPVPPRRLHRHDLYRARLQPRRHRMQLVGEAGEGANRALVGTLRDRDVVRRLAYVNARAMGVNGLVSMSSRMAATSSGHWASCAASLAARRPISSSERKRSRPFRR